MTHGVRSKRGGQALVPGLFVVAVFSSAGLVFLVEPMIAQLLLPRLGGSPAVWNTSLAFFQAALLLGYGYAHLLQWLGAVRRQMAVHILVLAMAGLVLPLHIPGALGASSTDHPILWLLGVLVLAIGPPFAALSATAPLLQAWFGRLEHDSAQRSDPYALYAASNLGSLLALLAYPFIVQPLMGLGGQRAGWSLAYAGFAILIVALAALLWRAPGVAAAVRPKPGPAAADTSPWRARFTWMLLAAAPASLLLGVTTHITTDVASAPFLWVPPLALYLLTFVIAFQSPPPIPPGVVLLLQAASVAICLMIMPIRSSLWLPLLGVHLTAFFLTALVCHQALAARRPPPEQLTDFYFWMSLGGVVGGSFNAFVAPVLFNAVWEYPLVLVLAGLARPWGLKPGGWITPGLLVVGLASAATVAFPHSPAPIWLQEVLFGVILLAVFVLRDRAPQFVVLLAALSIATETSQVRLSIRESFRSFFGVVQIGEFDSPGLGRLRYMVHGSTLHGAEAEEPALRCLPLVYYAPAGPIGQVVAAKQAAGPVSLGVVGLGTGTTASFVRAGDRIRFFEIDPLVIRLASDPRRFSYLHDCAKGPVSIVIGDARLSLAKAPSNQFDVLLIDAFSSDSVPVHLLTVEAMRTYLRVIKPDGVVILHLTNRNLELAPPAAAVAAAAGGAALAQTYRPPDSIPWFKESTTSVLIVARTPQALAAFRRDPRWKTADPDQVRPWTDDYSNVLGALVGRMMAP